MSTADEPLTAALRAYYRPQLVADGHVPTIAETGHETPTWGVRCYACSRQAEVYVWPCREGVGYEVPAEVVSLDDLTAARAEVARLTALITAPDGTDIPEPLLLELLAMANHAEGLDVPDDALLVPTTAAPVVADCRRCGGSGEMTAPYGFVAVCGRCGGTGKDPAAPDAVPAAATRAETPRSFPVTDPEHDAPDGAVVDGYRRVCGSWEREDDAVPAAAADRPVA